MPSACPICGQSHDPRGSCPQQPEGSRIGQVVAGKYRVTRLIGEGGMAAVYEACHVEIQRRFAVKLLHPWLSSDEEWLERFQREARAGGSLESEHIAAILDVGLTEDGAPYILMELLQGEDLAQRLSSEVSLKPHEAIEIISQACLGLQVAHDAGVVHRDLKPENLFLCPRAAGGFTVKLLDFGIAKLRDSQITQATRAGMVMGTPFYMSPEQAGGRGNVDHRTDIYALGVILFELLSGEKPFMAEDSNALLSRIVSGPTPSLREQCPALSVQLAEVVERGIARDPAKRYQTARDLAEALLPFWPSSRRAQRTAEAFSNGLRAPAAAGSVQRTQAEPSLTVRVTGPSERQFVPLGQVAPPKRRRVTLSGPGLPVGLAVAPPLDPGGAKSTPGQQAELGEAGAVVEPVASEAAPFEVPEFGDRTEPDALGSSAPDGGPPASGDEIAGDVAPKRERLQVGRYHAPLTAPPVSDHAGDRAQAPESVRTVSLRMALAPVVLGALLIALLVGALSGPGGSSSAAPRAAQGQSATDEGASVPQLGSPAREGLGTAVDPRTFNSGVGSTQGPASPSPLPSPPSSSEGTELGATTSDSALVRGSGEHTTRSAAGGPDAGVKVTPSGNDEPRVLETGTLSVRSNPPARVWVGSTLYGLSPLIGLRLPLGTHSVMLEHPELGRKRTRAVIAAGRLTTVTHDFASVALQANGNKRGAGEPTPQPSVSASSTQSPKPEAKPGCTPRWFVDAEGVRRVKPECLGIPGAAR